MNKVYNEQNLVTNRFKVTVFISLGFYLAVYFIKLLTIHNGFLTSITTIRFLFIGIITLKLGLYFVIYPTNLNLLKFQLNVLSHNDFYYNITNVINRFLGLFLICLSFYILYLL